MHVFLLEISVMLKGIIKNTTALVTAVILLVSTSGFTVFKHSCYTDRTTEYSVITPDFNCDHNDHTGHEHLPSCCGIQDLGGGASCEEGSCCETEAFIIKLHINVDIQDYKKAQLVDDFEFISEATIDVPPARKEIDDIIISNDLPPPLSGRALLIYLHQLNTPYPSV